MILLNRVILEGSGADWLERFKPYIQDGKTIVVAPHRVFGPETNDLVLQLRKRKISKVILGGMLANMCVESHMRELLEQWLRRIVWTERIASRTSATSPWHVPTTTPPASATRRPGSLQTDSGAFFPLVGPPPARTHRRI